MEQLNQATLYTPACPPTPIIPEEDRFSLEELQDYVEGHIELIQRDIGTIIVNEEGLLLELPYNKSASERFKMNLVGNVIFLEGNLKL